ncbi:probable glycerol-3-phosphate acyltransferase 8 [Cynara cardunculus var. scolymus]|uniref:probable glycerol-3-phosphate acyltransferase 8 n=1 Tax=Cynara cardunculus var. scolymus TaxID=59895 RepID=UPI000D627944|nr:probable glycerol-3-phosphate acyltransferase 8 [Cynara cardunculus var. scolymus]
MLPPELELANKTFPLISECDLSSVSHRSVAADLDGTLLKASLSFPYYILVAIEAGSLLRGLILLLCVPIIAVVYVFISEDFAGRMLIFVSFSGVKVSDIEVVARGVLPPFYAADVRSDSFQVFDSCQRKVIVTANPVVMVDTFVKDFLGGEKVLGTEIEVNPRTNRATGFVKEPGVLVGKWKKFAILKEFGEDLPDIGIGDRKSDHDFMSICKVGYMVPKDHSASMVSPDSLKTQPVFHKVQQASVMITYIRLPFRFILSFARVYCNLSLLKGIIRCTYRRRSSWW